MDESDKERRRAPTADPGFARERLSPMYIIVWKEGFVKVFFAGEACHSQC
jgi:hypothetical protein